MGEEFDVNQEFQKTKGFYEKEIAAFLPKYGVTAVIYNGVRTKEEQQFMIDRWEKKEAEEDTKVKEAKARGKVYIKKNPYSKPATNSQHTQGEAMDLHFYSGKTRVVDRELLKKIAIDIYQTFKKSVLQVGSYSWGVHIGMRTQRALNAKLKDSLYHNWQTV